MSRVFAPSRTKSSFAAGGAKGGKVSFAHLRWETDDSDSSDEEEPCLPLASGGSPPPAPAPQEPVASQPSLLPCMSSLKDALDREDVLWGDILCEENPMVICDSRPPSPPVLSADALWSMPFALNLEEPLNGVYDLRTLSEEEYQGIMSWLYVSGWYIESESRDYVRAYPDNLPSRVWVPPAGAPPLSAPGTDEGRRKGCPVPRFCRAATACKDAGCCYVHGDTIPKVNRLCGFGADCGASDPTGVKRSQCRFMHPGETWEESLVIRRPAASN
jgi:hypothetical protein